MANKKKPAAPAKPANQQNKPAKKQPGKKKGKGGK
jgi:hypothetical protein